MTSARRPDGGEPPKTPLWPFALIGLLGAVYLGVRFALGHWKSWLLAGAVIALGVALYYLIVPDHSQDE